MAANPFLFSEDCTGNPSSSQSAASSNPFLMDDDTSHAFMDENPFFSNVSQTATTASALTNPFAFDPMDLEPAEAEVPLHNISNTNAFMETTSTSNFFHSEPVNFFTTTTEENSNPVLIATSSSSPQKPTDLELKYTTNQAGPMRPPPPVQSKATQDLLMSVMGEMDATSSHLLNKIPPTRSPSPVSMRDLQSPSPTPEANFGDLLDVGDAKPGHHHHTGYVGNATQDFMSMDNDINQNLPPQIQSQPAPNVVQAPPSRPAIPPARPPAPARPPRPAPPQKPPAPPQKPIPPAIQQEVKAVQDVVEQKVVPTPSNAQQTSAQTDEDLFGIEGALPQPKIASKADILNLYNVKPEKQQPDLLCDTIDSEVTSNISIEPNDDVHNKTQTEPVSVVDNSMNTPIVSNKDKEEEVSITPVSSGINTANAMLSPASNDMQMDTSDSQSKGSVSSVTFNPFAVQEEAPTISLDQGHLENVFQKEPLRMEISATPAPAPTPIPLAEDNAFDFGYKDAPKISDDFDAFAEKFDSVKTQDGGAVDAFTSDGGNNAWGNDVSDGFGDIANGFGNEEPFDSFLAMQAPQSTRVYDQGFDDDEDRDFSVVIRPKTDQEFGGAIPILAPPPVQTHGAFSDSSPRFNPFDQQSTANSFELPVSQGAVGEQMELKRSDSQESPSTPLFDEDVSQPLEPFPRTNYTEEGWEMYLRQPNKKKITGQRFWKKIFLKLVHQVDCVLLQLFNQKEDKDPFQELPLQPCYSVSDIGAQQYDQFGKIFTVKLQYIFYKERPGVRPGQVKKAERITNKLSQFAAYAIQGDYQGVREFGSDLKKLGLPVEHAPQVSQLMKLGSLNYEDLKQFSFTLEEALFTLQAHRDRALHYKMEEVQITLVDELYVEQSSEGHIEKQIARVRLFFLGFLTGMPDVELGLNDMRRQGKEVVGRHDIIPVATEEWIRSDENVEFHSCIQQDEYENTHIIKFKPPDACYIELMRFRVRPPKNRELPLQLKAQIIVTGTRIELRADVLVPGFTSRKLGQIPCEDVMIRFPIPECWIYMFRVEKHFRYGSVKSAHRRTGKIKGIERILGTMETPQENLIEVTSGQAKYEHQHRAIVWRCPRLPKEGQGAYTTHNMVCKVALTSYDQMPEKLAEYCYVEFTMPATQVSHTVCRSVSLQNSDSDEPPEKYVRYLARHEYRVGIEHTEGENPNPYAAATYVSKPAPAPVQQKPAPVAEESSSDSD